MRVLTRLDGYQRRHRWVGEPLAVLYKFYDDQALYLAALLTYYGFLSLFPLLLILVVVLSTFLSDDPHLRQRVLDSALSEFPVIGDQIGENIRSFHGNGVALAVGIVGSLYGSLGVAQAAQYALNKIWAVPRHARPDPLRSRLKGLVFLLLLALGLCAFTLLSVAGSQTGVLGARLRGATWIAATAGSVCLSTVLLLLSYRLLTHRPLPLRRLLGVALGAAVAWQALQWVGSYYVSHVLRGATATYGLFGIVLGLLAWLYAGALIFITAAEVGAVQIMRLWPRSLLTPFTDRVHLSPADRRAYRSYAATEAFKGFQKIRVHFEPPPDAPRHDQPPEDTR
ncbi:YihY/virulence factor BrkB family protein [Streptomyces argyrophylli]|uniref:YihY/virulence factor BrkB family protein n=1 Tax=Streptomyces argyrophylli TaxID=2726118 RepID=A0A6M4PEW6_9ACTN|nr:YihY/virulence factor BrkB family protein [Streptomyces argyrophyllae]QJS08216.1 YihY/virulence factor BrkB family protein [Streptomyces argyrophyllae]